MTRAGGPRPVRLAALAGAVVLLAAVVAPPAPARAGHVATDPPVTRLAGATRVRTAVAVSSATWPSATHAVLATATAFPDALAGGALAAALDAPMLLVHRDHLPPEVAAELVRLDAREVVLLGGEAAVSREVAASVAALPTRPALRRLAGRDRFETAALAARAAVATSGTGSQVVIASGEVFPDALAGGALPGPTGRLPVLLAREDGLPGASRAALAELGPGQALLVGGPAVLGQGVAGAVTALGWRIERIAGADRFATSAAVLDRALERSGTVPRPLVVATGARFPDALPAAALAARLDGVLLLVPPERLTDGLDLLLRERRARLDGAVLVGGRSAVGAHVRSEIAAALADRPRPAVTVVTEAGFHGVAGPLPAEVAARMDGVSWRPGCPVALGELALTELTHHDLDGGVGHGLLVVHRDVAATVLAVFARLYDAGFPVARMRLVDDYGGSDAASMADNNTHAFNCRTVSGTSVWSRHAYGTAIDINPVQNPYVDGADVDPDAGTEYLVRTDLRPGMITRPGPVVAAFDAVGWGWGGDWTTVEDYQHFSASGR